MEKNTIQRFLNRVKNLEKKYEWIQAAESYKKASILALKNNDLIKTVKLQEKIGYCFYRGALQAKTNIEFKNHLRQAIIAYEEESKILEETNEKDKPVRINHVNGVITYVRSWLETSSFKREEFLAKWWTIENQTLTAYESGDDLKSAGRVCNDLLEMSFYNWFWFYSDYSEWEMKTNALYFIAEKAIQIFSKLGNTYELARAYCFASWYYSFGDWTWESQDKIIRLNQKCQDYSNKALQLSQEVGDAWLLSWSNIVALLAAQLCNFNPAMAMEYSKNATKYANITKDNFLLSYANYNTGNGIMGLAQLIEDPDKQKEGIEHAIIKFKESAHNSQIINHMHGIVAGYYGHSYALTRLASIETNSKTKRHILEKTTEVIQEGINSLGDWTIIITGFLASLSKNFHLLSKTKSEIKEKRTLLQKALSYAIKCVTKSEERYRFAYVGLSGAYYQLALVQNDLARIETNETEKIELLIKAVISLETCIGLVEKKRKIYFQSVWAIGIFGRYYDKLAEILQQIYFITKEKKRLIKSIMYYETATTLFKKADLPTHIAESHWHMAQLYNQLGEHQKASQKYELASEVYDIVSKKIPQLNQFYENYVLYMQAWSQIEHARHNHSIEKYDKAKERYEKAAKLHKLAEPWSYLAPFYFAWARVEEAESQSRQENTEQAKNAFQKALEQFAEAKEAIKNKIDERSSVDEKELTLKLFYVSDLRRRYCQARILLEDAKLLDRKGDYLQSSKSYGEAAENIEKIVEGLESEVERKELKLIGLLCRAWEKMANAEETTSSDSYLKAAKIFDQAKDLSGTKKSSLWALGNSSFCKGLAAGIKYQSTMNLKENALAKRHIKSAATSYLQAGFKTASEYAKATQRLFDAYVFMNQAESEVDPEKKTKQYQMANKLLQISADSFMKAKQPEKTAQVQRILVTVREEKVLAESLNDVMHAPTIASSTLSFATPTPTSEVSVGLENFEHANVQANLITHIKKVKVGESFCLSVEFINAGKEPALLTRVEKFIPSDFIVVKKPEIYRLEDTCLNMKGKQLPPLKLVEAKLILQPSKKGIYQFSPKVHYLDELGQNKTLQLKSIEIKVEEVLLEDRMSTGTKELDSLLLGGIPEGYAVALAGSPSDERESVINNFLKNGINQDQITFYISIEPTGLNDLLEKHPSTFYLFLCNPKPKAQVSNLTNVYTLRGKTDLTNLSIALAKGYRSIDQTSGPKRVCVEIVSDVLLDYGAKTARKWISELITDLGSKGFTMLAVINPLMHVSEELHAVLDLFDGEISLFESEDPVECKKFIRVKKLRNQDYIKNPICLLKTNN